MSYLQMVFNEIRQKMWWKTVLYGAAAIFAALLAVGAERYIPFDVPADISREAVAGLLNIISSSMLAVTTFSVGAVTTAFSSASDGVTPRATMLLQQDRVTHNVLSSFIGAFVFSVIGSIVLQTGSYGERGRVVLFVITVIVIALVVIQLLRWVNHLVSFGRGGSTMQRVEDAATRELETRLTTPYLGANPWRDDTTLPDTAHPIMLSEIGYLKFKDMRALSDICEKHDLEIYLPCNTGAFIVEDRPVAWVTGTLTKEIVENIRETFILAPARSFEQDPRFGVIVMAEIGSRALSSATNDAGTAIEVIGRLTRLLGIWSKGREDAPVEFPRLHLRPLTDEDMFDDAFLIMGRDGRDMIEIQLRLQKALRALSRMGGPSFRKAACSHAALLMSRAKASNMLPEDLAYIRQSIVNL